VSDVQAVVFDLGGVLIDWDPRRLFRTLIPDEAALDRFLSEVCTPQWNHEQDRGRPLAEATVELQRRHPEHADLIAAYYGRWEEMLGGPIHGTVEVLRALHADGLPVYALTNWSAELFPIALARYDFLSLFRGIVVSGEERLAKPEPEFFQILVDRFGVLPRRTVYVDDIAGHVEAARRIGFDALLFTSPDALRAELAARGLRVAA
jgi:2-haloacid dehalogenase